MLSHPWAFLDLIPDPVVVVDEAGTIAEVNALAEQAFGFTRGEFLGKSVEILLDEKLRTQHVLNRAGFMSKGRTRPMGSSLDLAALRKDGSTFPVEISLSPVEASDGRFVVAVLRDVSQRNRLQDAIRRLAESTTVESGLGFFQSLVRNLARMLQVSHVFIAERDPTTQSFARTIAVCSRGRIVENFVYLLEDTPCGNIVETREICYIPTGVRKHFPSNHVLADLDVESYIGIPLVDSTGFVHGFLVAFDDKPMTDHLLVRSMFEIFATRVSTELERVRLDEARRRAAAEAEALFQATKQITRSLDLNATLNSILDAAVQLAETDAAGIASLDGSGEWFRYDAVRGRRADVIRGRSYRLGEGLTGLAAQTGDIVNVPDAELELRWTPRQAIGVSGIRSGLFIPLRGRERVVGVLAAWSQAVGHFTPSHERLLGALSEAAALAIEHAREVAERARAETRLKFQADILRNVRDSVIVTDVDGKIIYWNEGATAIFGYLAEEMLGQTPITLYPDQDPGLLAADFERILDGQDYFGEWRGRRKDGSVVWVDIRTTCLRDEAANASGFIGVAKDITERKQAEEALRRSEQLYRLLIEGTTDSWAILDAEGMIRFCSPTVQGALGYSPAELVATQSLDLVHPDDRLRVAQTLEEVRSNPGKGFTVVFRVRASDGSWRWIEVISVNLLADPAISGVVVVSRDVTERKRLEERLLQSQKIEAMGKLAGGVAHDFNNLLTVITGFGEMLLEDLPPDSPHLESVDMILRSAETGAALTGQLLAFTRQQVVAPKDVDVNVILEQTSRMLRRLVGDDVTLTTGFRSEASVVHADLGQLEQVLVNLAANARDAMPSGGSLTVRTENVQLGSADVAAPPGVRSGHYVRISVEDTGSGMNAATKARIFEPFFTTKEVGKGSGLGLAAVYGIVTQNGGFIDVTSEVGRGTTFEIYLPRIETPKIATSVRAERLGLARGDATVLLVDDNNGLRQVARLVLEASGYTVLEARGGADALRLAEEHAGSIDLVLTDVVMPEMSGRLLVERLRQRYPSLKVLYMSGYTDDVVVHNGVVDADVGFIAKPFTPSTLTQKLRQVLDEPADSRRD